MNVGRYGVSSQIEIGTKHSRGRTQSFPILQDACKLSSLFQHGQGGADAGREDARAENLSNTGAPAFKFGFVS